MRRSLPETAGAGPRVCDYDMWTVSHSLRQDNCLLNHPGTAENVGRDAVGRDADASEIAVTLTRQNALLLSTPGRGQLLGS